MAPHQSSPLSHLTRRAHPCFALHEKSIHIANSARRLTRDAIQRRSREGRGSQAHRAMRASGIAAAAAPSAPSDVQYTVSVILQGARDRVRLYLTIVSEEDPSITSQQFNLSDKRKATVAPYERDDPTLAGTIVTLKDVRLPASFKPGVIILNKFAEPDAADETAPYVALIKLQPEGDKQPVVYTAYTYVDIQQGDRLIFPASRAFPAFPGATPKGLEEFRKSELDTFRGTAEDKTTERLGAERIYQFDVYNDLGEPGKSTPEKNRPVLGGSVFKYPRRLRTGRQLVGEDESPVPRGKLPWLPLDERFNSVKNYAFMGDTSDAGGRAVRAVVGTPRGIGFALNLIPFIRKMYSKTPRNIFSSLQVIDALYDDLVAGEKEEEKAFRRSANHSLSLIPLDLLPVVRLETIDALDTLQKAWSKFDDGLKKSLGLLEPAEDIDAYINERKAQAKSGSGSVEAPKPGLISRLWPGKMPAAARDDSATVGAEGLGQRVDNTIGLVRGLLEKWPVPRVREGRALEWKTDEEFGRSALAGQNPISIRAFTAEDLQQFCVKDEDVKDFLEGRKLPEALQEERLWTLDFHSGYKQYISKVKERDPQRVLYAGRCLLYTRNDGATVPVSIELETDGQPMRVFTPNNPPEVWLLAKTVISSLDSGIHQLISHWLRTHACVEPYIIATRRELSILNPVYKLLQPHFRYTMRINCNARDALINAGGIVEQGFTPGPFSMELSAVVYDSWRFNEQALPDDLLKRGVAERDENGKLRIKIPNYRYAEDGLLLWDAIQSFVGDYLSLYYDDNDESRKVTKDVEIKEWWKCVQKEGHPDIQTGWPEIKDVASLRDVIASIMWVSSCHHAAVNFGQYDYSGYVPYKPSKITAKIPEAGSQEEKELRNRFESTLLNSISDPVAALEVMVTVKILSAHAADEEYLDREEHRFIKEPEGVNFHKHFVDALNRAEKTIEKRNKSPSKGERGFPYTLLIPSNPSTEILPGARPAGRGIPYSISI